MVKKIIGYLLAGLGIIGIASTNITKIAEILKIQDLVSAEKTTILIASVILIAIGIFLLMSRRQISKSQEVPIYRGKRIIGYRQN